MCGISGYWHALSTQMSERMSRSLAAIEHRGPDAQQCVLEKNWGVGHTRLSIIDVATGAQPMWSPDRRYVIAFNGEIYNFKALRKRLAHDGYQFRTESDTEVVLALYSTQRERSVDELIGMFAFAVFDTQALTVFLARDRLGVKPLVYGIENDGLYFASNIPALTALAPALTNELDRAALLDYFNFQYIRAPHSAYHAIKKLAPGHTLLFNAKTGESAISRYWHPERIAPSTLTEQDAAQRLRELLRDATQIRLISERPLGAFLSGGLDSSISVSMMSELMTHPVETYTVAFADIAYDESSYATVAARHFDTNHHEVRVEYDQTVVDVIERVIATIGEPFGDRSFIPAYYLAQAAAQDLTVVLTGDGADETWAGYKRHYYAALFGFLKSTNLTPIWRYGRQLSCAIERWRGKNKSFPSGPFEQLLAENNGDPRGLVRKWETSQLRELLSQDEFPVVEPAIERYPSNPDWDELTKFLFYDMQTFLCDCVLTKVDTTTMLHGLEARSPFLDYRVVEFALSLPARYKLHRFRESKYLLKLAFSDRLPPTVLTRKKMGFTPPMANWFRTILKDWIADLIHSSPCRKYLNQGQLIRYFAEHQQGKNRTRELWLCGIFLTWLKQHEHRYR